MQACRFECEPIIRTQARRFEREPVISNAIRCFEHQSVVDLTVIVTCKRDDMFKVTTKATFSISLLPGRYSPLLGIVTLSNDGTDSMYVLASTGLILNS